MKVCKLVLKEMFGKCYAKTDWWTLSEEIATSFWALGSVCQAYLKISSQ